MKVSGCSTVGMHEPSVRKDHWRGTVLAGLSGKISLLLILVCERIHD